MKSILEEARDKVYRAANTEMVQAYWSIGQMIVEEEQKGSDRAEYGKYLIATLSAKLTAEYGKGFHKTNLWNMIQFYRTFPIVDAVRRQLSWTHYRILMRIEKDDGTREKTQQMNTIQRSVYKVFLKEIKKKILETQYKALKAVNLELINLNWDIGKSIVEKQEQLGWGKSVVDNLSKDLQAEFPGMQGFSSRNLWLMRSFYLEYEDNKKLQPLVAEISWTHNLILMEKCKDLLEREFYLRVIKKYGWSKSILIHQIESEAYERYLLNQTNFDKALEEKYRHQVNLAVKDS